MTMGLKANADGSGAVQVGGSDAITITSGLAVSIPQTLSVSGTGSVAGNLSFNSGYGSAAVAYGCRAWVNFNGTGTVAIRASGNVSSITDNGVGDYTINFTNAMPDTNYSSCGFGNAGGANYQIFGGSQGSGYVANTGSLRCQFGFVSSTGGILTNQDPPIACVQIFR